MTSKKTVGAMKSPRAILSIATVAVLGIIVYASRHELQKAWELFGQADVLLLLLLVPFQIVVYFSGGEMIFSYLRDKRDIHHVSRFE